MMAHYSPKMQSTGSTGSIMLGILEVRLGIWDHSVGIIEAATVPLGACGAALRKGRSGKAVDQSSGPYRATRLRHETLPPKVHLFLRLQVYQIIHNLEPQVQIISMCMRIYIYMIPTHFGA